MRDRRLRTSMTRASDSFAPAPAPDPAASIVRCLPWYASTRSLSPESWEALAASGSMRVHQSITQSDLEKNRWPPMSMRLPLYSIDCDKPPTLRVASSTTMSRTPASASSQAAVRPAGPAPMISTRIPMADSKASVPGEQQQFARHEIEGEHGARRNDLGDLIRKRETLYARVDDQLV